jgi:hypothetical protein
VEASERQPGSIIARSPNGQTLVLNPSSVGRYGAILNEVGGDQREWEKQEAEDEVADETVAFAAGNARRPKRHGNPDG